MILLHKKKTKRVYEYVEHHPENTLRSVFLLIRAAVVD
jgi:hypothetical protein